MSEDMMPERITQRDERHRPVEYIRADVAQAEIARAEDMATQAVEAWRKATAAHDVIIEQWKTEEQMWRDADKKQLARIAELEAAQRWVSVDERLPELYQAVKVYTDWEIYRNQVATWGRDVSGNSRWIGATGTVTHWMPLPPPPTTRT